MDNRILGLHHITAIAGDAQQNYDFYTKALGLRMVKKTVNFDDPQTYHFYFGDKEGTPGTLLTFFPWPGAKKGRNGAGMATEIGYSVPEGSLNFWAAQFEKWKVPYETLSKKFGEEYLAFKDPDGLNLQLIVSKNPDTRKPWVTDEISADVAIRGFHNVTLTVTDHKPTAEILVNIFGYTPEEVEGNFYRYRAGSVETAALVDIFEDPNASDGQTAAGTNHHVAFRVKDEQTQMDIREKVLQHGLQITEKINRDYFFSVYFREPGGVLFEIATDNPGFTIDESVGELGSRLQLPDRYKKFRDQIEKALPPLIQ